MRVRVLGGGAGGLLGSYLTTLLVDDVVAVDAGCLGFVGEPEDQARVRDVLLTHAHLDHIASLPIFLENVYESSGRCARVHGHAGVLAEVRTHLFNGRIWPDFVALSETGPALVELVEFQREQAFSVGNLRVTPIALSHAVPSYAFALEGPDSAVLIAGDTAPTRRLWEVARELPRLEAVFIEASFPDDMAEMARLTKHLTPAMLAEEKRRSELDVRFFAYHLKARHRVRVREEIAAIGDPDLVVAPFDEDLEF